MNPCATWAMNTLMLSAVAGEAEHNEGTDAFRSTLDALLALSTAYR